MDVHRIARGKAAAPGAPALLDDVLCGVDGSRRGFEAVAQAATLVGEGGRISLIAVPWRKGLGVPDMSDLTPARAQHALDHAREVAELLGARVVSEILEPADMASDAIFARAREHGFLAIGAPPVSRAQGKFLGSVASRSVHFLPTSLLLAREAPGRFGFGRRIVVASDGGPASDGVVRMAGEIARRCDGRVTLIHASGDEPAEARHRCAHQAVDLFDSVGVEPVFRATNGRPADVIVDAARREDTSLIVVGSRRQRGLAAIGSVSERVAHRAPCSVLVVRPDDIEP